MGITYTEGAFRTINSRISRGATERRGEWFNREITITNTSDPVWQQVQVVAGSVTNGGGVAFPKQSQSLVYDLDGNLAFDGIWSYAWDAENRLRSMWMTNIANIAHSNRLRLDFAYDYMGRRGGVRP